MNLPWILFGIGLSLQTASAATAVDGAVPLGHSIEIRVEAGDWGSVNPHDIETVLTSVAATLLPHFPQHAARRIAVAYKTDGPSILLERTSGGAHRVFLSVRDARWDQFAYQFAHELCHVFTNHEHRRIADGTLNRDHQWFEETLCEAVSLFALERMAARWKDAPPYAHWRGYAPAFLAYEQGLLAAPHRQLSPGETLAHWFAASREALARNPYLRQKNELLAVHLLTLLETVPDGLAAIGYLNAEAATPPPSLAAYLESWRSCCPPGQRAFVIQVMALFDGEGREQPARTL